MLGEKQAIIKSLLCNMHQGRKTGTRTGHWEQQEISASFQSKFCIYFWFGSYNLSATINLKRQKSKKMQYLYKTAVCIGNYYCRCFKSSPRSFLFMYLIRLHFPMKLVVNGYSTFSTLVSWLQTLEYLCVYSVISLFNWHIISWFSMLYVVSQSIVKKKKGRLKCIQ